MLYNNKRPTGQKQQLLDGRMVENKGKLISTTRLAKLVCLNFRIYEESFLNGSMGQKILRKKENNFGG